MDGKGDLELAKRLQRYAESKQVPFYLFSMVGQSAKYNPLASGGITSKKDRIIELRNWTEDHYRKIGEGYLQIVFSLLAHDQIVNLIDQGRSAGIHAILSTQSLSDIEKKGGKPLVGQVMNNCNNYFIFRQNNHDDAEQLAKMIGTFDSHQITSQLEKSVGSTGVGTVRSTKEFLVDPDEIKRLGCGRQLLLNKQIFCISGVAIRKGVIT